MSKISANHSLQPGFRLKSKERTYEIVKVLGAGSFGITYLATGEVSVGNITTTIKFAIKEHFLSASCYRADDGSTVLTVPTAQSDVMGSRSDFLTEANRLKKICLKSRSIVSVNETFEANGTAYYVMEFLDGGNPGLSSEADAVEIVRQIAEAVRHIHEENVLHLDIKPDNIVLKTNEKGETYPVLIDFGISKHFDGKGKPTSSLSAKGASQGYAPQEQYAGISEFSPKYDIYALGAVLFYLVTGKNPPDAFKISANQQELKKELTGKVSPTIEKAILNAMKPSAMERTATIDQFSEELSGFEFVPELKTEISQLKFDKNKGEETILVESNLPWEAYSTQSWCKVKKIGDNLNIKVSKNNSDGSSTRQCEVILKGTTRNVSFNIQISQQGKGTIVFQKKQRPTWLEQNSKKVYVGGTALALIGGIVLLCILLQPDPQLESAKLTEAIESRDQDELRNFAEKDSARAFAPYAQLLFNHGDIEKAEFYALLAKQTADSVWANNILAKIPPTINTENELLPLEDTVVVVEVQPTLAEAVSEPQPASPSVATVNTSSQSYQSNSNYTQPTQTQQQQLQSQTGSPSSNSVSSSQSSSNSEKRLQEAIQDPSKGMIELLKLATIEHYAPSYYYYARQALQTGKTAEAVKYLKMSIDKGVNVAISRELLDAIEN